MAYPGNTKRLSALVPMLTRETIPPNGEALGSLLLGCSSLSIAPVDGATLMGWQMKGVARKVAIAVSSRTRPVLKISGRRAGGQFPIDVGTSVREAGVVERTGEPSALPWRSWA